MSREPIHPGLHIAEELAERGLSARALARALKVPAPRITEIMKGRRGISGDTALRLGAWFGTSPEYWMNLQSLYEIDLARRALRQPISRLVRPAKAA